MFIALRCIRLKRNPLFKTNFTELYIYFFIIYSFNEYLSIPTMYKIKHALEGHVLSWSISKRCSYQNNTHVPSVPQSPQVQNQIYFDSFTSNLMLLLMDEIISDNEGCKVIKGFPSLKKTWPSVPLTTCNMSFCLNIYVIKI